MNMKMKKIFYTIGLVLLAASCSDEYTDWADPQSHDEDVKTVTMQLAPVNDIDLALVTTDSVQLFAPVVTADPVKGNTFDVTLYNTDKTAQATLSANGNGWVKTSELAQAVGDLYTVRPVFRNIPIAVKGYTDVGGTVVKNVGSTTASVKPDAPMLEERYYLTGTLNAWNFSDKSYEVTNGGGDPYVNPAFSITLPADVVGNGIEFKLTPLSGLGRQDLCITAAKSGEEGRIGFDNEGGNLKVTPVAGSKYYRLDFNLLEKTYTVTAMNDPELFLTGDHYNWGGTWKALVPVHSTTDTFWTIIYLHAGEQFKFAPQAGWGNDFGMEATITDNAGVGITNSGGNITATNAGWYLIKVVTGATPKVTFQHPDIYLFGATAGNQWDYNDVNKFTVPTTEDGEFVSPAFTNDGEVRMCIRLDGIDWWKTEFIVNKYNRIDFRGKGGDQERVNVKAGQRAYLKFGAGSGMYK